MGQEERPGRGAVGAAGAGPPAGTGQRRTATKKRVDWRSTDATRGPGQQHGLLEKGNESWAWASGSDCCSSGLAGGALVD